MQGRCEGRCAGYVYFFKVVDVYTQKKYVLFSLWENIFFYRAPLYCSNPPPPSYPPSSLSQHYLIFPDKPITLHHTTSYPITQHHTPSHPITPHHTPSHPITPHHTPSHPITPHHTTSHHITQHLTPSHPITSHHTPSHHITPPYTPSSMHYSHSQPHFHIRDCRGKKFVTFFCAQIFSYASLDRELQHLTGNWRKNTFEKYV